MFEIERETCFTCCQVCGNDASEHCSDSIYTIRIMNRNNQGTELHLCANCCNILSKLTDHPDKCMYGVRMMSIDELPDNIKYG